MLDSELKVSGSNHVVSGLFFTDSRAVIAIFMPPLKEAAVKQLTWV